jgi:pimeloyl-ACP methyl ester carboxylesterase
MLTALQSTATPPILTIMLGLAILLLIGLALVLAAGTLAVVRAVTHPPRKTYAAALAKGDPTDPADLGREGQAITLHFSDGATAPGYVIAGDRADGPTVLILHGFGDSRYGAMTWIDRLAPHARRLVVFDQRGHGEASSPYPLAGEQEAADALSVLDQLDEAGPCVLFGYSMGAQIAIAAACRAAKTGDSRIAGVIAEGPYRRWREPLAAMLRCHRLPAEPFLTLAQGLVALRLGKAVRFDRAADAARLACPLLVLHGENDPICPLPAAQAIAEAAPHGKLVTFPDGRHLDLVTLAPDRYDQALAEFFQQLPTTSEPTPKITPNV